MQDLPSNLAKLLDSGIDELLDIGDTGDICLDGDRTVASDLSHGSCGALFIAEVVDDNAGTLLHEPESSGLADTLGSAGDENDLALERHVRCCGGVVVVRTLEK